MRGWMPLLVMMTGCMDYKIVNPDGDDSDGFVTGISDGRSDGSDSTDREDSYESSDGQSNSGSSGSSSSGSSSSSSGNNGGSNNGSSSGASSARAPKKGELVIHELMIDPEAVDDAKGEWVEIYNDSDDVLDLSGHRLADADKDDTVIQESWSGSLEVQPGEYLVICANDNYFDNGGADCHGSFHYETWGGGFAMSNKGDEVLLVTPGGALLDSVSYGAVFSIPGVAMGLDDRAISTGENDYASNWCEQDRMMKSGDEGTPDRYNNLCL